MCTRTVIIVLLIILVVVIPRIRRLRPRVFALVLTTRLHTFVYFLSVGLGLVTRKITKSVGKNQIKPEMLIEIVRNRETKASGSSLY